MALGYGGKSCESAAVVVIWNCKGLLRQYLRCLLGKQGATCDILVAKR